MILFHTRYVILPILIVLYVFWAYHVVKAAKANKATPIYFISHGIIICILIIWGLIKLIPWIITNW